MARSLVSDPPPPLGPREARNPNHDRSRCVSLLNVPCLRVPTLVGVGRVATPFAPGCNQRMSMMVTGTGGVVVVARDMGLTPFREEGGAARQRGPRPCGTGWGVVPRRSR